MRLRGRHRSSVWCARKPGRELRENVELWLAWRRVAREVAQGILGAEFDQADHVDVQTEVTEAEGAAKDEVWGVGRLPLSWRWGILRWRTG